TSSQDSSSPSVQLPKQLEQEPTAKVKGALFLELPSPRLALPLLKDKSRCNMKLRLSVVTLLLPLLARGFELPASLQGPLDSLKHNLESLRDGANLDSLYSSFDALQQKLEMPAFVKQWTDPIGVSPILSLHRSLVSIESISGNENAVGNWLLDYLRKQGFTVEKQCVSMEKMPVVKEKQKNTVECRFNVLAYMGESRRTRTLITSHLDVVPPYLPYKVHGHEIYGRGSVDAKGSVASQIRAVEELREAGEISEGDVALLFVVGEEKKDANRDRHLVGGDGMREANGLGLSWETVIFGEPTELKLASGHKGIVEFTLSAQGRASHSGYPELGINANSLILPALLALDKLDLPSSESLGKSTLNIGRIEGGVAGNVVPAFAKARGSVRVAAKTPDYVKDLMIKAVDGVGVEGLT
ncbi:hypothetical protein GP486_008403, partial [Trichoglossum hirsutum]